MQTDIILRDLRIDDLDDFFMMNHPDKAFHKFNGPYFKQDSLEELQDYVVLLKSRFESGDPNPLKQKKVIADAQTDEIIGTVNWYWKSEETNWMEIGIVIFNEDYWGKGIGKKALPLWIEETFERHPDLVRLGLTTWSGNYRMMKLAESLGFKKEAVYRKARIVDGKYYDSISYGILKKEWYTAQAGIDQIDWQVNHITFSVSNLETSTQFYSNLFQKSPCALGERLSYFDLNGLWLALNLEKDIDRTHQSEIYTHVAFSVKEDTLEELKKHLESTNIRFEMGRARHPNEGNSIYLRDPDQHLIEFHTKTLSDRLNHYDAFRPDIQIKR